MAEYKPGDNVWLPGQVFTNGGGALVAFVIDNAEAIPSRWRPRTADAAPEPDVEQLREACRLALKLLEPSRWDSGPLSQAAYILRAALAETPAETAIEGPVRVGDRVSIEGTVVCEMSDDRVAIMLDVPTTVIMPRSMVKVVSRPAPAETCGRCRWFDKAQLHTCRQIDLEYEPHSPACAHFEAWPG